MATKQVFPNPTVKQVIFQIKFPNLFYIESKMGDLQLKIVNEFPESSLLYRTQVVFADVGPEEKRVDISPEMGRETARKIWQFKSPKNYQLSIQSDSLDIVSTYHKTYRLPGADRFRDVIKLAVDSFLEVIPIPTINRIGLRYVDECPIPSKDNAAFLSYYNSVFPLDRFGLSDATEMDFKAVVRRGRYNIRYVESLRKADDKHVLVLDFDGFAANVPSRDYLSTTDKLHGLISKEFEKTIKEPVYEYMKDRKKV